jgi:hypothetical protein
MRETHQHDEIWPKVVDGWGGKVCILRVNKKENPGQA